VGALINFVAATIVAKITSAPPEHIQHLVEDIRVPKGATGAVDH
jgi:cation/acetate symporter